jgi:hypothetical protein
MSRAALPDTCDVEQVNFYTAHISGRTDQTAPRRKHAYRRAIATLPDVRIHYGNFLVNQKSAGLKILSLFMSMMNAISKRRVIAPNRYNWKENETSAARIDAEHPDRHGPPANSISPIPPPFGQLSETLSTQLSETMSIGRILTQPAAEQGPACASPTSFPLRRTCVADGLDCAFARARQRHRRFVQHTPITSPLRRIGTAGTVKDLRP